MPFFRLSRAALALSFAAIALAACDTSSVGSLGSGSTAVTPGEATITSVSVAADQATVDWQLSSGALAEHWRLYQNDQQACSGTPTVVSSSDGNSYQIGSCTISLQPGSNDFYVQLCNFDSRGDSLCSQSISESIDYQEQTELGAIYLQDVPNSTSDSKIYVSWAKEEGANGDHWRIYHDDAQVCSGNLLYDEESFAQSAGCDVTLEVGINKLQAELCQAQPVGIDDICTYSATLSTTFSEDPARSLATPYIVDPEEVLPAEYDTSIAWIKDTSGGSAGEDWTLSNNGIIVCEAIMAGDVSNASCIVNLVAGSNLLQVRLCTDAITYSGATCKSSAIVTVEAFDPNPLEPGIIDITNNLAQLTYDPDLALEWRIVSGNDVSSWRVDLNGEQHCATGSDDSSTDKYYSNGYCFLDLELGNNTISVTGCNYGYQNSESCSTSLELSTEYVVLPGAPEITSSFPSTTYESEHSLSWERFDGEAADHWLGMVNDTSNCSGELLSQTPQSGSCAIQLDSGVNTILARLCISNNSGSAYCTDSAAEQIELLAPVPAQPEISTPAQVIADDIILLEWSKSDGDNGSYWSVDNNGAAVAACAGQPLLSSGSSQSGDCYLPLELGVNLVHVHLCNNNAAGTASCSISESVSIDRESAAPALTSASSASSAENNSAVFYTATVSDNDSSSDQISFSLSGADGSLLGIDSSGGVAFLEPADYESPQDADADNIYQFSIIATDQTNLQDQLELAVSVTNVNDNAPEFTSASAVSVAENTSGVIHTVQATDVEGDAIGYYISGADAGHFSLDLSSGELTFASPPDYESPQDQNQDNVYDFDFTASDGVNSTTQAFAVDISDSNDETPQATSLQSVALDLSSISLDSVIYTVTASDADAGDQLSYSHSGVDASHFSLDPSSGELRFVVLPSGADAEPLDADSDSVYQLEISISDLALNSSSFELAVAVADDIGHYPQFDLAHDQVSIPENSSGGFYTAVAVDPEGESVTYALSGADSGLFVIDSVSGTLSPLAPLDYESPLDAGLDNNYSLTILASDPLGNQSQQSLDVLVSNANDNPPSFSAQPTSITITENDVSTIDLSASDADGDDLSYSIAGNDAGAFFIDTSIGVVWFRATPDYENPQDQNQDNTYELAIIASDGVASAEQSFSLAVENSNDNTPSFGFTSDSASLSENDAAEALIYTATATDADRGDQVSYSLSGADASYFSIDGDSGAINATRSFDFENPLDADGDNIYELEIIASDGANSAYLNLRVILDNLNDNKPSFALESDSVSVNENISGVIYTAVAIDPDGAASLSYSLLGADASSLAIDSASGAISFVATPDFENPADNNADNQYYLEIRVSDGTNIASLDFSVLVSNVNDIAPAFAYSADSVSYTENGTGVVYTGVATDPEGDSIAYSLQGADASYFSIDSTSGALSFSSPPDFENPIDQNRDNRYQVDIEAFDGANSSALILTVVVEDSNDNPPGFALAAETTRVPENSSGTIYTAAATDPDSTANLTYSLQGADAQLFAINSSSGALSFIDSPDFESPADQGSDNHYQLDIEAFDGAQSAFLSLTVIVEDINDNSPSFTQSSHSLAVAENTTSTIYTAAATDLDAIDSLTYSLQGADAHHFTINSSSGALAFYSAPDYESPSDQNSDQHYQLDIKASDGSNSAILSLTVEVTNLNDNAPSFAAASESFELPESSSGNIYSAAATDLDGDAITYSISGADSSFFTINASSGVVSLPSPLDFESPLDQDTANTYELAIEASDGVSSASLAVSVELSDVNDNSPSFAQTSEALTIPENSSGVFYTASASDPDISDSLTYSIQGSDAQHFSINASSGELALPNALDFENPLDQGGNNIYELSISASDGANTAALSLKITLEDLNDNGPRFAQISDAIAIAESVSGSIYTASATDPDGDLITYSLAGADANYFSLNSSSGILSLPSALDFENPLDQNSDNHYQLEISADDGSSSATLSLSVELSDVNDNPPSFAAQSDTITVAENTSTIFYTASASDPDATASLSYSLSGVDSSLFTIDSSSGALAFRSAPDFENPLDSGKDNGYELDIGVSDGGNSASLKLTVQVTNANDSAPVFSVTPSLVSVSEASSSSVYTVAATDPEADSITYSVDGVDALWFVLDPSSGVLSFRNSPDFENPQDQDGDNAYQITIKASDSLNSTSFDLVVAVEDANDNAPIFDLTSDFIAVFEDDSSVIYTATASDPDTTSTISYSLTGTDATRFSIHGSSGELSFATAPDFEAPLDQDGDNEYQFTISASDGQYSATLDLLVEVKDTNDNPPVFSPTSASASVIENTSGVVYTAIATDLDASASITYSFSTSAGDSSLFALNSSSGAVSLLNPLDREQPIDSDSDNAYQLPITASDGIYSASLDLTITISDANDNPPSFEPASESVSVSEDSSGVIYTAAATDPDSSAVLSYSLLSGLDASHFAIEASSGALSFVTTPDFENPADQDQHNDYELAISVSDSIASASLSLTIVVSDANDNTPVFAQAAASVTVPENTSSSVYTAAATDQDAIDSLSYSLAGSDADQFSIGVTSGVIFFEAPPDYENPQDSNQDNTYELVITAGDGTNSASQELNVSVSNLSDSVPAFALSADSLSIPENTSGVIYSATATDADGDSLSYSIGGDDASFFDIDSVSGALSFVTAPDRENPQDSDQDNTYELSITASDGASSASLELLVSVTDINDNKPKFAASSASILVVEDSTSSVYTADADDPDTSDTLTYSISGTDAHLFSIDSSSGDLTFLSPPDFENPSDTNGDNVYELSITASDGINSATLSLKASVINLNDSAPRFGSLSDSVDVDENSAGSFYTAAATDPENNTISYSISGGDAALFSIDSASGDIAFLAPPDFENPGGQNADNSYEFDITADDGTYLGEMILTVTVADVNDNDPSFTSATDSATLVENDTDVFYQATANDPDTVGALTYSLAGLDSAPFTIDPASGELSATTGLDFEQPSDVNQDNTYEFEITAFDGIASANLALTVAVSNVNDTAPTFSVATESITFTEHSADVVYTAQATDPEGDTPSYSISGTDSALFSIDSVSGELAFKTPPDFEATTDHNGDNTYELNIIASDSVNSASLALTVAVQDINDNTPSFAASNATISVAENNASSIYTAAATDLDATDILSYSISGTDSSLFTIDSSSGALAFNSAPDFENPSDSDKDNTYELSITASDGSNQGAQALTITVSNVNEPLSFTTTSVNLSTAENNTSFAHIVEAAVDEDQGQQLSYQLGGADQSAFSLDSATRALSFANSPDYEKPVDQDSNNAYQIDIIASDGEYEATQSIAIAVTDLNDEAPQFTSLDLQTVDYTLTQVGDIVYTAQATDADAGDQISFNLGGTDAAKFDFDPSTGELSFNTLPAVADFPTDGSGITYNLTITAIDLAANSTDLALTVKLLDDTGTAPTFSQANVTISVDENVLGSVYTAQATDIDVGDTLSYSISGTDYQIFTIDSSSGELSFNTSPDYENPSDDGKNNTYDLTISATDSMAKQAHQSLTIAVNDLNDNSPSFDPASDSLQVPENTSGTIYTAQATDLDASDSLSYTLSGTDFTLLQIDPSSGELSFINSPDFETPEDQGSDNTYAIDIIAFDGTNSDTLALTIEVTNLNDNAPDFAADPGSIDVNENATGLIHSASASDADGDTFSYSLGGADADHFDLDPDSGELSLASALDFEIPSDQNSNNDYELEITASDSANSSTLTLTVLIQDLNDNVPSFGQSSHSFSVAENTSGTIYTAQASDDDATDTITYSLSGADSSLFSIASSGALSFQQAPDYETPLDQGPDNNYALDIIASDGTNTATLALAIEVTNLNDNAPSFDSDPGSINVDEGATGSIYSASATDADGDDLTYSLGGTDSGHFTLNTSSGALSLPSALDFENPSDANTNNDYELEITASDGTNSASLALTISVQDLNDNSPSFTPASDSIQIAENTSGTIYTASATDLDATDTITYTLAGTDSALLQIGASSGALSFQQTPDFENPQDQDGDNFYELEIIASDSANSTSLALTIEILNTSEQPPEITQLIGGDQAIDFTFDDFGTSKQLSIYRFTDDACSTADLASDHTQCYASDDSSSDTAKIDFSGALASADYQVSDSGLRAGQRYYYQIWAAESSSASDIGVWSVRYSAMTWPAADVGTTLGYDASATTGTQIVLSFVAPSSGDDDYYHFLRHSDPDCASYPAGTALNRADYSDWSALVDPINGGTCSGLTELSLSGANLHAPSGGASDSHSDSGLAEGTTYYYLLRTVNYSGANGVDFTTRSGASATSNQLQWTTVPPAPAADDLQILSSPAVAADQISIAFASVAGASSYKLVRYIPANCSVADQQIASVESCSGSTGYAEQDFNAAQSSYTDSGLQAGSTYAYQYRALNAAGSSQYSPAVSATTTFDKPTISLASSVSLADANVISVSWSASSGIDSYSILGSSNETCLISATASADPQASAAACDHSISASAASSTTSTDIDQLDDGSALASGSYYYFAAAAVSSSGSSDYSDVASAITAPASPNVISLSPGYQQVEVAWDIPTGSAENVLYRYTESTCSLSSFPSNCGLDTGSYTFTNSIPNDAYIDDNSGNGLVDNQMYYYALQASNAGGARYTESASVPVVLTAPKTPDSLIASGEQLAVQLRWGSSPTDADDGVAGYEILRSSSSTCYGGSISAYADYASCPDAALFLFDYGSGEDQNEYQFSDNDLDPSSGSEPLAGGTTYYYWIRSFYGSTNDAVYSASTSAPASATPILPAPTNLAVDAEQSGASTDISIAWDEVASASGYVLYRTTSADCLTITNRNTSEAQNDCADYQREELSGSSTTATTHSDLPSDTIYYYYVAAANSAVEGELSSALSTRSATVAPTITSTQTYSNTVVRVEWDASSAYDATYHLYAYSGDSSCNPFTTECPHESLTTFTADGSSDYYNYAQQLEPGTHYNFKMLAITEYEQEDGTEDFVHGAISSAAATATTAANHPTITGHEYVDYNYFDLFVSIEGGLDSVLYWVLYTRDANCSVNDVIAGQCAVGGQLGTAEPASSIRLANYDFGVYYYVLSLNSEDYSLLSPDEDTPPYLVPARPAQVELSVNATKNSSGNGTDIKIEWQQSSGVDGYVLYRTTSSGCITDSNRNDSSTKSNCDDYQRQEISGSSTTTTTHSNLPNDTIYHYSVATISNGSEGTLSESIATHTATTAPPIVDVITYNQSQIEVTWWATSAFETDYYIYAYSGDASCDPHAEVCPGEKLSSIAFNGTVEHSTVISGLTPGTRYNFKAYSNVAYPQENGGTDYIVGYISETAEAKTNYTFANHPTITGHQENDDGDILLEFAIDGGTDDLTYYIFRTTNGDCTITEVVNSESECTDRGTATATPEQNVVIHKVDDNDYYYHVISANPVGPLAWDDSTEPYYIPSYVVVKDIDVEMTHYVAHSNSDFIGIEFVAAEPIPADNKWTLRMYPPLIENSEVKEYVLTNEQVADDDSVLVFQIKPKYYFQPHAFELYASRLDDTDFILLASFIVWDIQPPPLVAVEKNSDSNKYSEEKDFDIYILHYHDDFDISSVVGIETLKADITMIFTDADAVLCRPPYVPIVDMIYGNCPLVRSYTDWWDGSELLFNRVEGDTGNQLLHDVVVSNNETYQASQGLFQVYDITFAGTTPIYDDQDDPWSFFVGPYISSFTIDTDFGKYSLDYEEAFSYLSIELAFGEDEMAEFQVYGSSSSNALLPTPTLVLSPALLSQGLSAGSAYNSWDLHLLWEAINGINSYAIHEYSDSDCAYLLSAPELCGNYNLHSSLSPDFSHAFAAADMGSYFYYRLQAYDAAGNSSELGEQIAVHIPQALNDSGLGLDTCVVSDALSGAQDCASGRDASVAASVKVGSGSAGFDFSLLEADADASASSDSLCVHDNTTGLSWSSWSVPVDDLASAAEPETNATRSAATFAELATITLDACGYSDWSLPSIHELLSIADYNQTEAKIDSSFFTGFNSSQPSYWSASGHILDFSSGDISLEANASAAHSVLLVRADRRWGHDFGAERFQLVEHIDDGNTSIHLVYDNHSQLHYAPCLAGQSYDPINHSCLGTPTELDYIDSLNAYDSNSTWRQPNIKELIAILDPTHNLLPNPEYFPNPTSNSTSDSSTNSDSNSSASDSSTDYSSDIDSDLPYPAPIFILTPSSQSPDHITGRQLNPSNQSTTATTSFSTLNSYLIYEPLTTN